MFGDPNNKTIGVYTFECFTHEQVKEINKRIKKNILRKENQIDSASNVTSKKMKIGDFSIVPCFPLMELLHPWLYHCQLVNRSVFGYDTYWDFHLETFNYNVYGIDGEYGWHIDANRKNT